MVLQLKLGHKLSMYNNDTYLAYVSLISVEQAYFRIGKHKGLPTD
jgi:hypothetical protein